MKSFAAFVVVLLCCSVALADPGGNPDTPQNLAALWPMVGLAIANLTAYGTRKLSAEYTFFHTGTGAIVLALVGSVISSVTPIIQAHGFVWASLAWAAVGAATSFLATLNPSTTADQPPAKSPAAAKLAALLPFLLLPLLASSGCAGFKAPAYTTLTTMAAATGAAAVQLPPICESEENAAVDASTSKDDAIAKTGAIHARCQTTLAILKGTGDGLTSARDAIHDAPTGADLTAVMPWLRLAVKQYCDIAPLLDSFPALKAKFPMIPGVC